MPDYDTFRLIFLLQILAPVKNMQIICGKLYSFLNQLDFLLVTSAVNFRYGTEFKGELDVKSSDRWYCRKKKHSIHKSGHEVQLSFGETMNRRSRKFTIHSYTYVFWIHIGIHSQRKKKNTIKIEQKPYLIRFSFFFYFFFRVPFLISVVETQIHTVT